MRLIVEIVLILLQLDLTIPSTHWLITEVGKIEAQPDSIFMMRQSHDLVAFIHQERRFIDMNDLHEKLSVFRGQLDDTSLDVPDVEAMLAQKDADCIYAGRSLTQFDLYISTMVPFNAMKKLKIISIDSKTKLKEPLCSKMEIMNLEIPYIDELSGVAERGELMMQEETGIMPVLLEDGKIRLSQYGHSVAKNLSKDKTSWSSYNLAALYWRMKGDPYETIECLRRALYFGATEESQTVSLVNLGNVLHQSLRSEDAAEILELAARRDPKNVVIHYTLGNVFAVLMQYNKSIESFGNAVNILDDLEWVKKRKAAVECHRKLEIALEAQHSKLQKTLDELKQYQGQHAAWSTMNNKLHSVQASLESRVASRDSYETYKLQTEGTRFRPQGCYENIADGKKVLECVQINYDIQNKPMHSVFRRTHQTGESSIKSEEKKVGETEINSDEKSREKPSKKKRYPKLGNFNEFINYNKPGWPGKDECVTYVTKFPEWTQLPTVFLPPDNKGYDLRKMVNADISLSPSEQHSLPWYPPLCDSEKFKDLKLPTRFQSLPGFSTSMSKEKFPDESIKARFLYSFGLKHEMKENIAELGARLRSAQDRGLWPDWLLNIVIGTYHRILGNTGASVTCFGLALSEAPLEYSDLVLTNLAGLLYKLGHVDAALKLVEEAEAVCDSEPETHFFLATLLAAKGNMSGSIKHYRETLRLEPDYPGGVNQLRIPSCYVKYHLHDGPDEGNGGHCHAAGHGGKECRQQGPGHQGNRDFILCRNGVCRFVSREDIENLPEAQSGKEILEETFNIKIPDKEEVTTQKPTLPLKLEAKKELESPEKISDLIKEKARESNTVYETPIIVKSQKIEERGPVEVSVIAVTQDEEASKKSFVNDDALPDLLIKPTINENFQLPSSDLEACIRVESKDYLDLFTSTWMIATEKNKRFSDFLPNYRTVDIIEEPVCYEVPPGMRSLDHLAGVKYKHLLSYKAEAGLTDAFQSLVKSDQNEQADVELVGSMIAMAMSYDPQSWLLTSGAALYWRIKGDVEKAVECLRHSLHFAPTQMRDMPLIALANILHRSGLYNDAIIAANSALEISPSLVVTHFTLANIYASKMDFEKAKLFYISTLTLQSSFEPALERLRKVLCREKIQESHRKKSK